MNLGKNKGQYMFTTFEELSKMKWDKKPTDKELFNDKLDKLGQELAADIVAELKRSEVSPEMRKELNKERISALGLKLIQGGKHE